jgi:hypothetical protein
VAPLLRDREDGVAYDVYDEGGGRLPQFFRRSDAFATVELEGREGGRIAAKGAPTSDDGNDRDVAATEGGETGPDQVDCAPSESTPSDPRGGNAGMLPTEEGRRGGILTKKELKKLAREKARQLEETLSAARDRNDAASGNAAASATDDDVDEPARKKSKKRKGGSDGQNFGDSNGTATPLSRPTSLMRECRLGGGLIVSDVLIEAGAPVRPGKRISLHYTGSLRSNGEVFDRNNRNNS